MKATQLLHNQARVSGSTTSPAICSTFDIYDLAAKLQDEGAKASVGSWNERMNVIASKSSRLAKARLTQ